MMTERLDMPDVPHLSEFISDEMDARNWDMAQLATAMAQASGDEWGKCKLMLDMFFIVGPDDTRCRVGDTMADMLAKSFGISKPFFLNIEAAWLRSKGIEADANSDQYRRPSFRRTQSGINGRSQKD